MKSLGFLFLVVVANFPPSAGFGGHGRNGGVSCLVCTSLVAELEQLVEFRNSTVVKTLDVICDLFPSQVYYSCKETIKYLGPSIIILLSHNHGPDVVCHALTMCYTQPGLPTCQSRFSPPLEPREVPFKVRVAKAKTLLYPHVKQFPVPFSICDIPGIKIICNWVNRTISERRPLEDFDHDGFSPTMSFRGSAWRGKDCSDIFSSTHPGAIPKNGDMYQDSNCNGIYGTNPETKKTYEEELCSMSQPRGVATLGDSISAHFSLPPSWLDATKVSREAFKPLVMVIEDESDWPMLGSFTGHGENSWTSIIPGRIDSIYNRLVERNRCNHRDYQNIAENGEDSFSVHNIMTSLSRNKTKDHPLTLFIILLGNDVCQGDSQDLDKMTTPEEMKKNTWTTLKFLAQHLPPGSSVVLVGLVNGSILFDSMADRIHPLGNFWQQFTYSEFYDYLNCLKISPCPAWMTTNKTTRQRAAKRVVELNKMLSDLAASERSTFSNFNLYYVEDPLKAVLKEWKAQGGEPWQLIQTSDGFHSNQMGQALTAGVVWNSVMASYPEAFGPVNPHNAKIQQLFGDQGGL